METFKIDESINIKDWEGFIYRISSRNGRHYIGKKNFHSKRKVAGRKNRKTVESDWAKYTSSCKALKQAIKNSPHEFNYEVLCLCADASSLSYMEMKYQMENDSMTDPLSYNENCRITLLNKIKEINKRIKILK